MKKIMSFLIIAAMLVTIAVPFALAAPRDKSYEWLTTMSFYHMEPIGDDVILVRASEPIVKDCSSDRCKR